MSVETETIDRLFLELSQFTKAKTNKELVLESRLDSLRQQLADTQRKLEAALSTEAQNSRPLKATPEMLDAGDKVALIRSKRGDDPYIANLEMVYAEMIAAAPAPSPCTLEEAADIAMKLGLKSMFGCFVELGPAEIAAIINADREKR